MHEITPLNVKGVANIFSDLMLLFVFCCVIMKGTGCALFSVGSRWGTIWAQNVDISSAVGANPLGRSCCADPPRFARREGRNK